MENPKDTNAVKSARIELKTTPSMKAELELAANLRGETLTSFILQEMVHRARKVIAEQHIVRVSDDAWNALNEVLSKPVKATPQLRELIHNMR